MADTIDGILDDGATQGLAYFTDLAPRYRRAFPTAPTIHLPTIYATYDAERGLDIRTLAATAAGLQTVLATAETQCDRQRQVSRLLPIAWQGEAGARGTQVVADLADRAATDHAAARKVLDALHSASVTVPQAVRDKVNVIDGVLIGGRVEVGGLSPDDIDAVIDGRSTGELDRTVWHRMLPGSGYPAKSPETVAEACRRWLADTFDYSYVQKLGVFIAACANAQAAIEDQLDAIVTALNAVAETPYDSARAISPADQERTSPSGTAIHTGTPATTLLPGHPGGIDRPAPAGPESASGTTVTAKPTAPTPDEESGHPADPSAFITALGEFATTLSSALTGDFAASLSAAVESVASSISESIHQLTDHANSAPPGEEDTSFQLGETTVHVEAMDDGLLLTTTDADGETNQFRLVLDENGDVAVQPETHAESPDDIGEDCGKNAPAESAPEELVTLQNPEATNPGLDERDSSAPFIPPPAPRIQQEDDEEHTSTVPDHPGIASGAELAEAGPL